MNGKIRMLIFVVIIISTLVLETEPAYACSCVLPGPPDEELTNAAAVFSGRVIDIVKPINFGSISSADPIKVTFQVQEVWKGSVSLTTTITTARSGASCGYIFKKGSEYIVYADGSENNLSVSMCSRTQPLDAAELDLQVLGAGAAPTANKLQGEFFTDAQGPILVAAGIGMILLVLVVAVIITNKTSI